VLIAVLIWYLVPSPIGLIIALAILLLVLLAAFGGVRRRP
jgi:MYXO-CTERM domain-containing protein